MPPVKSKRHAGKKQIKQRIKRRPTLRKKRLINLITENLGNMDTGKPPKMTMYAMMLAAGYSHNSAAQQVNILSGIGEDLDNIEDDLKKIRITAIKRLATENFSFVCAKDVSIIIDKLTRNIQLLSNKPTENIGIKGITGMIIKKDEHSV